MPVGNILVAPVKEYLGCVRPEFIISREEFQTRDIGDVVRVEANGPLAQRSGLVWKVSFVVVSDGSKLKPGPRPAHHGSC